jgi:hypothetical protein
LPIGDVVQHCQGVENLRRVAGRDVDPLTELCPDRQERGVERSLLKATARSVTGVSSSIVTPIAAIRWTSASTMSRGRRYCGIP